MKDLKGSRTEANLMAAFAGESQVRNKYTYFAAKAKEDGFEQISTIFTQVAHNEKEHAEIWFKLLNEGVPYTENNLKEAAGGEHFEWTQMYADFAKQAREEGFDSIANLFDGVAKIENSHENRFLKLLDEMQTKTVFEKNTEVTWKCSNCGHEHKGTAAPKVCPVCSHLQAYFEVKTE